METKTIRLADLILWDENARFPDNQFNSDEKKLIDFFVTKSQYEITKFIEEIVKDFDLPQLEKLVVWEDEGNFVVLEGNRRVASYKLLVSPELANNKKIENFIKEQKAKISIDGNFVLECVVTSDKVEGFRYLDRKHDRNNNEVNWQEPERVNYRTRRGSESGNDILKRGISLRVRKLDIPEDLKDRILGKGYVTSFFRVITSTSAKRKYAYGISDKNELEIGYSDFENELKVVIYTILQKEDLEGNKLDSRTLNKKEKIDEFIQSIDPQDSAMVDSQIQKHTKSDLFGNKEIAIGKGGASDIKPEKSSSFAPKSKSIPKGLFRSEDLPYTLNSASLRILYEELKNISVKDFPNAAHDLLRSFLECSLLFFLKETKDFDSIKKNDKHNPKLGEMLSFITNGDCSLIKDQNLINSLNSVKKDYDQAYSLERMNMINHNENFASSEKDVRKAFAQLEGLFKTILISPIKK